MNDSNVGAWYGIPLSCVECPIQRVEINCTHNNTDNGDWRFWDRRRRKQKSIMGTKNKKNRGLLMELCRRTNCNPEYLKYLLISQEYSAENCVCKYIEALQKEYAKIPHTNEAACSYIGGTNKDRCAQDIQNRLYSNPYDNPKTKTSEKMSKEWLDKLYELYNSVGGISPIDQLEDLVGEQRHEYLKHLCMSEFGDAFNYMENGDDNGLNDGLDDDDFDERKRREPDYYGDNGNRNENEKPPRKSHSRKMSRHSVRNSRRMLIYMKYPSEFRPTHALKVHQRLSRHSRVSTKRSLRSMRTVRSVRMLNK